MREDDRMIEVGQTEPDELWDVAIGYAEQMEGERAGTVGVSAPYDPAAWQAVHDAVELAALEQEQARAEWLKGYAP